ncbi:hypothetical protein XM38_050240 [Halomicronema hongdechloris C2206]|uniref:histidine kinase n=1 Tax=Halomicronema hongdechloris C2206 TaxID=1641165 RepID=A0A1Z3HUQ6_9CYAN|nr:GAF domain-containing hybrid sensor histidine kinase/response regulator [Halomicronema hongdechloris]ASC74050.1 hypothetical protein XM38_050240 [Halomicronema hongdechloris C2206]
MFSFADIPYYPLPRAVLQRMQHYLEWQQRQLGGTLLTTAHPAVSAAVAPYGVYLLVAPSLAVLVLHRPRAREEVTDNVSLILEKETMVEFLHYLQASLAAESPHQALLSILEAELSNSPSPEYGPFFLKLMAAAMVGEPVSAPQTDGTTPEKPDPESHCQCQPLRQALDQQLEQSLLLNHVVQKIQGSLELPAILETTVAEVRRFLEADRLLVYQFAVDPDQSPEPSPPPLAPDKSAGQSHHAGYIAYESRANDTISSVLHHSEHYCFIKPPHSQARYYQGHPLVVDDIVAAYHHCDCLQTVLQQAQVQSMLIVPILVDQTLWGLLIAHQCTHQRQWQSWELTFLQHIGEHLAIAIHQAQLYRELQQQTQNLESCVVERTQDLRDALIAAQSANRAKGEFLATMSHELRTPLTCIIGMSATLLRWSFGDLSPRQQHYLTTIHQSGEHLLELINNILEVSKIESRRTALDISEFSLAALAHQVADAFRQDALTQEVTLTVELSLGADQDRFIADFRRVGQILANLLSNAIKFTPPGGQVCLRIRRDQQMAVLIVEDTGIGIPEMQQSLLFEKFQQLETARQRQYQGTGLGLALTQQLVDLHGGSIQVSSTVGEGSVFMVRLPMQSLAGPTRPMASAPAITADSEVGRIVLVEDNEETASLICDLLTAADYQVIWVMEGSTVVEQVKLLQPAAVIINLNMADTHGGGIMQALRSTPTTASVKIVALIDVGDAEQSMAAHRVGADEVLPAAIVPDQLLTTIHTLMTSLPVP